MERGIASLIGMARRASEQSTLFDGAVTLPNGLVYRPEFLTRKEERELIDWFEDLPLTHPMQETYPAKRRIMNFGWNFNPDTQSFRDAPPLPPTLHTLARKVAKWLDIPETRIAEALVTEYTPGSAIGWHRDNEVCDVIIGVSLGSWCRMRLRPLRRHGKRTAREVITLPLEPRSIYVLRDESRWLYQHSIPSVPGLRYSVTLRTLPAHQATPRRTYQR